MGVFTALERGDAGPTAQLRIAVWPKGESKSGAVYTLACPKGKGTLPGGKRACTKLAQLGRAAFAPVPPDAVCTLIYGGPQVARVTGRLQNRSLWATFQRRNGCELARWNRLSFLFPLGPQTGTRPPVS